MKLVSSTIYELHCLSGLEKNLCCVLIMSISICIKSVAFINILLFSLQLNWSKCDCCSIFILYCTSVWNSWKCSWYCISWSSDGTGAYPGNSRCEVGLHPGYDTRVHTHIHKHIHTLKSFSIANPPAGIISEGGGRLMHYMHNSTNEISQGCKIQCQNQSMIKIKCFIKTKRSKSMEQQSEKKIRLRTYKMAFLETQQPGSTLFNLRLTSLTC